MAQCSQTNPLLITVLDERHFARMRNQSPSIQQELEGEGLSLQWVGRVHPHSHGPLSGRRRTLSVEYSDVGVQYHRRTAHLEGSFRSVLAGVVGQSRRIHPSIRAHPQNQQFQVGRTGNVTVLPDLTAHSRVRFLCLRVIKGLIDKQVSASSSSGAVVLSPPSVFDVAQFAALTFSCNSAAILQSAVIPRTKAFGHRRQCSLALPKALERFTRERTTAVGTQA